jgi:hypothetical protein
VPKIKPLITVVDDDESMREAIRGLRVRRGVFELYQASQHLLLDRGCADARDDRDRAAPPPLRVGKEHTDHSDHGLPRRKRSEARIGRRGRVLPEQAFRRERPAHLYPLVGKYLTDLGPLLRLIRIGGRT